MPNVRGYSNERYLQRDTPRPRKKVAQVGGKQYKAGGKAGMSLQGIIRFDNLGQNIGWFTLHLIGGVFLLVYSEFTAIRRKYRG